MDQLLPTFSDLIHTILTPNIPKLDPSKPDHRRLIISTANLTIRDNHTADQWRQWQKTVGRALNRVAMGPACLEDISLVQPHEAWLNFPMALELNKDEKQLAITELLRFLGFQEKGVGRKPGVLINYNDGNNKSSNRLQLNRVISQHDKANNIHPGQQHSDAGSNIKQCASSAEDTEETFLVEERLQRINCLDFLPNAPMDFRMDHLQEDPVPTSIFLMITQSRLLADHFRSGRFGDQLVEQFVDFERHQNKRKELAQFVGRMDFLVANLDVLVELRHFMPNLGARLAQVRQKKLKIHVKFLIQFS